MIIWGGQHGTESVTVTPTPTLDDGAGYDPDSKRWSILPPAPIAGRALHIGVWTGKEMLIWGGGGDDTDYTPMNHGAAYDPATRQGRLLAR